jgi:hypothetical protein
MAAKEKEMKGQANERGCIPWQKKRAMIGRRKMSRPSGAEKEGRGLPFYHTAAPPEQAHWDF